MNPYAQEDLDLIWHPCSQMKDYQELPPIVIDRGEGMYVYDVDGNRYMDIISSWWCNLLGHGEKTIKSALKDQLDTLEHVIFANFSHVPAISLCRRLKKILPAGLSKFFFTDNGSSAVEVALKMSFQYHFQTGNPQKRRFMALNNAYHGETIGALSVGGMSLYSEIFRPMMRDAIRIDAPQGSRCPHHQSCQNCSRQCLAAAEQAFQNHANDVCALIVEPMIQMAGGMRTYPAELLKRLRELCDEYNVHLIADEIGTGFGRTGKMFACEWAGTQPDIMCVSKGLTGGYLPMALAVTTQSIYDAFYADYDSHRAFVHSHTYSGNPLACAAAGAVLDVFERENVLEKAVAKAPLLTRMIHESFADCPFAGDIRSIGLINAVELLADPQTDTPFDSSKRIGFQIYKKALKNGLILRPIGDLIYFNPPLIISEQEMSQAVRLCRESVRAVLE